MLAQTAPPASYYDNLGYPDAFSGGARMITIDTPKDSHLARYDDQARYFEGLTAFLPRFE